MFCFVVLGLGLCIAYPWRLVVVVLDFFHTAVDNESMARCDQDNMGAFVEGPFVRDMGSSG